MNVYNPTTTARDPRCPQCGRPVVGPAIYGLEGPYHPACVQPPQAAPEPLPTPMRPVFDNLWRQFDVICTANPVPGVPPHYDLDKLCND